MIKSKAIDLIKTLKPKEFKEFGDFVRSPYFNKNPKLVLLYEVFNEYYPDFNSLKFTKELVFARLFPGEKYKDNEVRRNLSVILKLEEEYLSHLRIKKNEQFIIKKSLLHELGTRKLYKLFDAQIEEIYDKYIQAENVDENYFMRNFDIQVIKLDYDQERLPSRESKDVTISNLLNCFKYLMGFSLITALKLNQDFVAMNINYNFDNKNTIAYNYLERLNLRDFLEDIKKYDETLYYILKIYYNHFLVMAGFDKDDSQYKVLKKLIYENIGQFSRFEKYNLMLFLESGASIKIKEGKTAFVAELHKIHKEMIKRNLYESDDSNYMHLIRFWKIINNSLYLKEYGWTENFISEYSPKLHPESIQHMKNYGYSLLNFAKGDYRKSLEHASKVKSYVINMNNETKVVKLKCNYELGYTEEIFYMLDSIKHSLSKDNSPEWAKKRFENFIKYFEKLVKLKLNESISEYEISSFKHELQTAEDLTEKQWLLEKI